MTSKLSTPSLVVVDVGHGNAAVLQDTNGVVVFDSGKKGPALLEFLRETGIKEIESLILSHADDDHIGNAATLLLSAEVLVKRVYYNSDPTKDTDSHQQFQLAVRDARRKRHTEAHSALTTTLSGKLDSGEVNIEVLYPSPEEFVTGVGGRGFGGKQTTSNSLSAAIRLSHDREPVVLLGGDVGVECLDYWAEEKMSAKAQVLVFPHHGGRPGDSEPGPFAERMAKCVFPETVIFSVHHSRFDLPREDVTAAIRKVLPAVRFLCTQLPERLVPEVKSSKASPWFLHRCPKKGSAGWWNGHIEVKFSKGCGEIGAYSPAPKRSIRPRK